MPKKRDIRPYVDPLFKNYVDHVKMFVLERLAHEHAQEFKQAIIDCNALKKEMKLDDNQYLFQIIDKSHQITYASAARIALELIADYHHWLAGNYRLVPKSEDEK